MSYQLNFQTHHELVNVLFPTLQENSEPELSIAEAKMAASAIIDILVPKICDIVDQEVVAALKRVNLMTGPG